MAAADAKAGRAHHHAAAGHTAEPPTPPVGGVGGPDEWDQFAPLPLMSRWYQ